MLCRGFVFFNIFYMRDANKLFPKNYTKRVNCLIDAGKWHLIAHSSGFQQFHTPLWPYYIFTIRRTTIFFPLHIFMVGLQRDRELYCWMNIYIYISIHSIPCFATIIPSHPRNPIKMQLPDEMKKDSSWWYIVQQRFWMAISIALTQHKTQSGIDKN